MSNIRRNDGEEPGDEGIDLISKLPDPIIHHILSFIPTIDAVRMSVLAKRWRRMWYSVPTLNLSDKEIQRRNNPNCHNFIDKCLKWRDSNTRYIGDSSLTRFNLEMSYYGGKDRVDKWLKFVAKYNVPELDLRLRPMYDGNAYSLPESIFKIVESFTLLKLDGLKMDGPRICLRSLKLLSLKNIEGLNDSSFEDLLANCPSLKTLELRRCNELSSPRVSSPSLNSFEVELSFNQTIKIEAANLQFLLVQASTRNCKITLDPIMNLKRLSLIELKFDHRWLEDFRLSLESLKLNECDGCENLNIISQRLKNFVFCKRTHQKIDSITIDTPNLVSFSYTTRNVHPFEISLKNTPNLLVCNVTIVGCQLKYDSNWYFGLISLLSNLSCSKNICLHVYSDEALIFPTQLRRICRPSLVSLENLEVKTYRPLSKEPDLIREALYWLSPSLKSLSTEHQERGFY
ncbi:hypothetical protein TIFTF001_004019 [Ficus carica]|uniref:F-box domain-containing protein n=1 Tax=Ficus carica TaxID=3494 RepID=A0AA88CSK5_FICCA|nr:hypothetical protein TIFTF001_004019 [Ficus carica]